MADFNESREVADTAKSIGELTMKVTVDVSDALTGLKAVERSARVAKRAIAEIGAESYSMSVSEIERLADCILHNYGHEPGRTGEDESAVDTAIRLLTNREISAIPTADLVAELGRRDGVKSFIGLGGNIRVGNGERMTLPRRKRVMFIEEPDVVEDAE